MSVIQNSRWYQCRPPSCSRIAGVALAVPSCLHALPGTGGQACCLDSGIVERIGRRRGRATAPARQPRRAYCSGPAASASGSQIATCAPRWPSQGSIWRGQSLGGIRQDGHVTERAITAMAQRRRKASPSATGGRRIPYRWKEVCLQDDDRWCGCRPLQTASQCAKWWI